MFDIFNFEVLYTSTIICFTEIILCPKLLYKLTLSVIILFLSTEVAWCSSNTIIKKSTKPKSFTKNLIKFDPVI